MYDETYDEYYEIEPKYVEFNKYQNLKEELENISYEKIDLEVKVEELEEELKLYKQTEVKKYEKMVYHNQEKINQEN